MLENFIFMFLNVLRTWQILKCGYLKKEHQKVLCFFFFAWVFTIHPIYHCSTWVKMETKINWINASCFLSLPNLKYTLLAFPFRVQAQLWTSYIIIPVCVSPLSIHSSDYWFEFSKLQLNGQILKDIPGDIY